MTQTIRLSSNETYDLPDIPAVPKIWNVQNILIFVGALATFIVGILAESGSFLPSGTSHEVAVISGVVGQIGALAATLLTIVSHNSTVSNYNSSIMDIHSQAVAAKVG